MFTRNLSQVMIFITDCNWSNNEDQLSVSANIHNIDFIYIMDIVLFNSGLLTNVNKLCMLTVNKLTSKTDNFKNLKT